MSMRQAAPVDPRERLINLSLSNIQMWKRRLRIGAIRAIVYSRQSRLADNSSKLRNLQILKLWQLPLKCQIRCPRRGMIAFSALTVNVDTLKQSLTGTSPAARTSLTNLSHRLAKQDLRLDMIVS